MTTTAETLPRRPEPAARLRVVADPTGVDLVGAEAAVGQLLAALGQDLRDPHLADTPRNNLTSTENGPSL